MRSTIASRWAVIAEPWCDDPSLTDLDARLAAQDDLDEHLGRWTALHTKFEVEARLREAGVPVSAVLKPEERIDLEGSTAEFGLWPTVRHTEMGDVRVDGQPAHFSRTDWHLERGAPCLGEHNEEVLSRLLGYSAEEIAALREEGVL